ncbi:type II 3-dehydroquinate dehydratase [Veronia nyctiphanis]|uniref:3-dehydroquinate dehydratase n=1 Tax=Veronia nyctiphanis TaxID=1278244 RepID=A0A4Q0YQH4_9GAMM|nr:type II 3-dehydroquinate dehydratase [Veronia nyctiphanis]RXJ72825.1 type II 3-dehydroquinate dehydratase [Veronia nyctiphanis]
MKSVLILNGPNLNLLGQREPEKYGTSTLHDVEQLCRETAAKHDLSVTCLQSNHEGELIEALHQAGKALLKGDMLGVVFNAGAYTHTSVALADAIKGANVPVVEVHISNVHQRESFRHHSFLTPVSEGVIAGFGITSYVLAIEGW